MQSYKRNQTEGAISLVVGEGSAPSAGLQTKVKRLLDTDRKLGHKPRSKEPELANYAFYSGNASGRGSDFWLSSYEVFALLEALNLMEHGSTQARAVSILRRARPALEQKHAAILQWDPAKLFDEQKIRESARPGSLAVWSTRPVFLVIASRKGSVTKQGSDAEVAVLEADQLTPFSRKRPGFLLSITELTRIAHDLRDALAKTKPSKRGRGSS